MNKHDLNRRNKTIQTLFKAKEQLEEVALYLNVNVDPPMEDIYCVNDAHEHVCIALERLGVSIEGGESDGTHVSN